MRRRSGVGEGAGAGRVCKCVCCCSASAWQDWLRHWPRQQLLVLRYEDYIAALPQHLKAVLAFLDVPEPADAGTIQAMTGAAVQNNRTYSPMRPDTRAVLEEFYAPFNAALAEALGDNDARWKWADMHSLGD